MSELFVTSNPSEYTRLPGLYLTETAPPSGVVGVDVNRVGFFGKCVRGPLTPQVISSSARFEEVYGGRDILEDGALVGEVWKALVGKPFGTIVVQRVAAAAAASAAVTIDAKITVTASSPGTWGNGLTVAVENASSGVATECNIRLTWRDDVVLLQNINLNSTSNNIAAVMGDDISNYVTIAKIANGRPVNTAATPLTGGTEGTLATGDYTASLDLIADYAGISVVLCPESLEDTVAAAAQATLNAAIVTKSASVSDRIFLMWSGLPANSVASDISAAGTQLTTKNDRMVWCYNAGKVIDPITATQIECGPHVFMASILSNTFVDVHPGSYETREFLSGITQLRKESITRNDLILLRNAGISTLEKLTGGFQFRDAITVSLTPALTEITRRRMVDYLQLSSIGYLQPFVKSKSTQSNRDGMTAGLDAFLNGLKADESIVETYDPISIITTAAERSMGIEKILMRIKLISHMLYVVLETEIGTTVVITEQV